MKKYTDIIYLNFTSVKDKTYVTVENGGEYRGFTFELLGRYIFPILI